MSVCKHCGSKNLFEEEVHLEIVTICQDCGGSQPTQTLKEVENCGQVGYNLSRSTTLERKYGVAVGSRTHEFSKAARDALKRIKNYTLRFSNGTQLYEEAKFKFSGLVRKPEYYCANFDFKMNIATACLIVVLRSHQCKVLIDEICSELGIGVRNINKLLMQLNGREVTLTKDIVDSLFSDIPAISNNVSLRQATDDMCGFLDAVNLSSSYSRRSVAICALYFAYISEEPLTLMPLSLPKFCKTFKFSFKKVRHVCSETRKKLLLFAKRLPWVSNAVLERKYHCYIRKIIKSKYALLSESANDTTVPFEGKRERSEEEESAEEDNHPPKVLITEQMVLEMPPCSIRSLKNPRIVTDDPEPINVSSAETLDEKDMSEAELSQYIRTEQEIEIAGRIQNLIKEEEE